MTSFDTEAYMAGNANIQALKLFPWPKTLLIDVTKGQMGQLSGLTWVGYLDALGAYSDAHAKYPRHLVQINTTGVSKEDLLSWGMSWGLAVQAMVERGYLDPQTGEITPPPPA